MLRCARFSRSNDNDSEKISKKKKAQNEKVGLPPLYEFDTFCGFVLVFMMAIAFVECLHSQSSSPVLSCEQQVPRLLPNSSFLSIVDIAANIAKPNMDNVPRDTFSRACILIQVSNL